MFYFEDFVPEMKSAPAFLKVAEYDSFDAAVVAANHWVSENRIQVVNIETVVLPNIWSRYEEGSQDTSLGTSGEMPSYWHQFVRVWYRASSSSGSEES